MAFPTLDPLAFPDDVAGADNVARANCLLNAFRVAVNNSLAVMAMVDGVVDEFEDETGVDGTASTDETYDSTDDYYYNPSPGYVMIAQDEGTIDDSGTSAFGYAGRVAANAFDGVLHPTNASENFANTAVVSSGNAALGKDWGEARLVTKAIAYGKSDGNNFTYYAHDLSFQAWNGSTWIDLDTTRIASPTSGLEITFTYSGETAYTKHRIMVDNSSPFDQVAFGEIEFYETDVAPDMVLQSETSVAEAAPDEAFLCVWQEDVDAVIENSDLLAYVTRDADAGTPEWTQVTLTEEATLATGRILTGSVSISGAASDVDMAWKLVVANNKEQRIHGVGLSWS
jgi:hypothetical protein